MQTKIISKVSLWSQNAEPESAHNLILGRIRFSMEKLCMFPAIRGFTAVPDLLCGIVESVLYPDIFRITVNAVVSSLNHFWL